MNFYNGDIVGEIYIVRNMINSAKRGIENAEFRLQQTPNDEMWENIKFNETNKFQKAQVQFDSLMKQFMSLKSEYPTDKWEYMLKKLGNVLAITQDIKHIENSLFDERELQEALDQTSDMITLKRNELETLENEDLIVITNAELDYYESDMKKHHWGESRLEILNSDRKIRK